MATASTLLMALPVIAIADRVPRGLREPAPTAGDHILFRLPAFPVPSWYAGVQHRRAGVGRGGAVGGRRRSRLACLLCCIGAANTLANPKRALRMLPGALYELGVAVTVALSVAPQLVESVAAGAASRARRRLRGSRTVPGRGPAGVARDRASRSLHDALDRSLRLAAAMDSRGYGRTGRASPAARRLTAGLLLTGLPVCASAAYGLLDPTVPRRSASAGSPSARSLCVAGLALGGRRVSRSRYRPDPWRWPEWVVAASGLTSAVVLSLQRRL